MRTSLLILLFILSITSVFAQQTPIQLPCKPISVQEYSPKENAMSKRKKRMKSKSKTIMTNFAEHNFRVFTC